ncbi:hypothetical protein CHLNCDRAFT_144259 [Chlorella variabilis]|uniref:Cytochrome P450 n=1 Tax=Chlorella variabilis TaxID=554065 RepID=E1ZCA3_CHLVA|nr:hypothetical protein CHLNCDRAFT_144259 [Chlorella variabilis]EFN56775.1 hypothetical protein CHLNCDRAFT_144259 [Chlorella variabilis]|eukprot:XP_005848877.1 hypothetical protein CHLNCDRAFT_144259 [Chlorella variabilis]
MAAAAATFVLCGGCRIGNSGNAIPSPFPFWSDLIIETRKRGFPDFVKLHAQHGPLFYWRFLGPRKLFVGSFEAVKQLLGPWGMVNISGKQHARVKRLAQAAFTPRAIRGYLPRMQTIAEQAVQKWAADGDILWFTFRIAVEIIVGFDDGWTSPRQFPTISAEFKTWLEGLFRRVRQQHLDRTRFFPLPIPGTAFARGMKMRAALMRRIHASLDLLEERNAAAAAGSPGEASGHNGDAGSPAAEQRTTLDFLKSSRDENGNTLTRQAEGTEQIADTVLTLLFAGHDTSSSSLTRIFHHLHNHPEAAERLRREQADVVAKHGSVITEAALHDMPYADGVVRETLRITPIVVGFSRVALQDFELCGYTVPAGTGMTCSLAQPLLTDARWQGEEQPLAFKPERWLAGAALKQGAWIPFGGGQRLCLGWLLAMTEMKVLLAAIFRGHAMELRQPDEPWVSFPLARPKCSMPARFVAVKDAE